MAGTSAAGRGGGVSLEIAYQDHTKHSFFTYFKHGKKGIGSNGKEMRPMNLCLIKLR